jgi:hypothetical protein
VRERLKVGPLVFKLVAGTSFHFPFDFLRGRCARHWQPLFKKAQN